MTFDDGNWDLWINGVKRKSVPNKNVIRETRTSNYFAKSNMNDKLLKGSIAFVKIYDSVLSDREIVYNYLKNKPANTVAYEWDLRKGKNVKETHSGEECVVVGG